MKRVVKATIWINREGQVVPPQHPEAYLPLAEGLEIPEEVYQRYFEKATEEKGEAKHEKGPKATKHWRRAGATKAS